jgi:hypothetical protein
LTVFGLSCLSGGCGRLASVDGAAGIDSSRTNLDAQPEFDSAWPDSGALDSSVTDSAAFDAQGCLDAGYPINQSPRSATYWKQCDGSGNNYCGWLYQCAICDAGIAHATCRVIAGGASECIPADRCPLEDSDVTQCRCGDGPQCGPNAVCVSDTEAGVPRCQCVTPGAACGDPKCSTPP